MFQEKAKNRTAQWMSLKISKVDVRLRTTFLVTRLCNVYVVVWHFSCLSESYLKFSQFRETAKKQIQVIFAKGFKYLSPNENGRKKMLAAAQNFWHLFMCFKTCTVPKISLNSVKFHLKKCQEMWFYSKAL